MIRSYQPNVVYHSTEYKFHGPIFETRITAGIGAFLETLETSGSGRRPVELGGDYVGGIKINGNNADATLPCCFIPSDKARSQGIGRPLLDTTMDHCRAPGFLPAFRTTFCSLDKSPAFTSSPGSV